MRLQNVCLGGIHFFMITATKENKTERLVARVTLRDKAVMEQAAELEGRSLAAFVVTHLREHSREVIEKHAAIRLNEEESLGFVKALNARPQKPTPAMKSALKAYSETVIEQ